MRLLHRAQVSLADHGTGEAGVVESRRVEARDVEAARTERVFDSFGDISLGDRVEVDGVAGRVVQINLRSTTVVTNDNISIIVPNSSFISSKVVNWSHGDPKVRLRLPVGVAYGGDPEQVKRVLLEVAAAKPEVLKQPEPNVFFDNFGDSALHFELAVWTSEMLTSPRRFRSELNFAIEKALRENGIQIPFPQRDLHLRSGALVVSTTAGETRVRVAQKDETPPTDQK